MRGRRGGRDAYGRAIFGPTREGEEEEKGAGAGAHRAAVLQGKGPGGCQEGGGGGEEGEGGEGERSPWQLRSCGTYGYPRGARGVRGPVNGYDTL